MKNWVRLHFLGSGAPNGKIMYEEWIALANKHNLPTSIDIAANIPPLSNPGSLMDM